MIMGDESMEIFLNKDLEQQICDAIDPRFLLQLVCHFYLLLFFELRFYMSKAPQSSEQYYCFSSFLLAGEL